MKKNLTKKHRGLTVAQYAKAKMLQIAFLMKLGLTDTKFGGRRAVGIPYRDTEGRECALRFRTSMKKDGFRWEVGTTQSLYGLWRIKRMRKAGFVVLDEGESDTQTLWAHNFPALGLPGAYSWRENWAAFLADFPKIYLIIEPDRGGKAVLKWLAKSSIRERAYLVRLDGGKDPSELYLKEPSKFREAFKKALAKAIPWAEDRTASTESATPRRSQATQLARLAKGFELFHTPDGEPYASINLNSHWETMRLRDRAFRRRLAQQFYQDSGAAPSSQAVNDAMTVIEGRAVFEGPEQETHVRLAEQDGSIFLDLANEQWEAVEISAEGWSVVARPPVKFRRPRGMLALPRPVRGGNIEELRPFVNVASDDDWVLLIAWLVQALRPRGPFPVQVLQGEQGSAKTTLAKVLRSLLDPNSCPLRSEPRDIRDLMIAASNGWCVGFDNVSALSPRLADAICRLSTGSGFSTRELYTDEEEKLFTATRPVLLNGIDGLVVRSDLQDRSIVSYLPMIPENRRKSENNLWPSFEEARPRILGALLDGVSTALGRLPEVKLTKLPRMADFATWATAARTSFGWPRGEFLGAYRRNREASNSAALEASPLFPAIRKFLKEMDSFTWTGTATRLLEELNRHRDEAFDHNRRGWPKTPGYLSAQLRRLAPNLRTAGINVDFEQAPGSRSNKTISIGVSDQSDAGDAIDA